MEPRAELRRQLGLSSATALVVGEVIGVGIFLTPAGMARSLGSPFWLLVVWLVMGVMALAGALCFGALAARYPEAGGGYVYLRQAYGPRMAFLYGWLALLVTDPGLTAALAAGMASYVSNLVELSPAGVKAVAIGTIFTIACANILGLRLAAGLLRGLTFVKVGLLALLAIWGFGRQLGDWSNFIPLIAQRSGSEPLPQALVGAAIAAFFSFGGWWDLSKVAGEVRDPATTMPRALVYGVSIVTIVYILTSAVFLYLVPLSLISTDRGFAAQAGEALFGPAGGSIFSSIVIVSVCGSLAAFMLAAPRVYFAMARDGLFLRSVAAIHPGFGTPARAILLQAVLAALLVATGTFEQILGYFVVATVAFVALIITTVYRLHSGSGSGPTQALGYPFTPLLFLVPAAALLVLLTMTSALRSLMGLGIVALGIPVYQLAVARRPTASPYS
jgi:APA family basic amino acid/polyamine antiporter